MSKPVEFVGIYKDAFEGFIQYRKSLGYKYDKATEREFLRLNIHLDSYGCDKVMLTEHMVREYIERFRSRSISTIHGKECDVRQFGLYLKNTGYEDIYILPENNIIWNHILLPVSKRISQRFSKRTYSFFNKDSPSCRNSCRSRPCQCACA